MSGLSLQAWRHGALLAGDVGADVIQHRMKQGPDPGALADVGIRQGRAQWAVGGCSLPIHSGAFQLPRFRKFHPTAIPTVSNCPEESGREGNRETTGGLMKWRRKRARGNHWVGSVQQPL